MMDWALNIFVTPLEWVMISIGTNYQASNYWEFGFMLLVFMTSLILRHQKLTDPPGIASD